MLHPLVLLLNDSVSNLVADENPDLANQSLSPDKSDYSSGTHH